MEEKEIHLVKKVSKELGLTYKELGKKIGYSEASLKKSVHDKKISFQLETAIELYLKNLQLEEKLDEAENFKKVLRTFIS